MIRSTWIYRFIGLLLLSVVAIGMLPIISAQDGSTVAPAMEFTGTIETINGTSIVVAGLSVDGSAVVIAGLQPGTVVTINGQLDGTVIRATTIVIVSQPAATPEAESTATITPEATAEPTSTEPIIVIEGPVTVINLEASSITIFDFDILVDASNPIFTFIDVGDELRVEATFGTNGSYRAVTVGNVTSTAVVTGASVGLDGPVEAIDGNIVTVNGIQVQLDPNDPILANLVVGDFLSVQGDFVNNGTTVVLVVVNVIILNVTVNVDYCWYHEGMGMGHWHCDGMGMGMGGMGMGGMGMGMGMGG